MPLARNAVSSGLAFRWGATNDEAHSPQAQHDANEAYSLEAYSYEAIQQA